MFSVIHTALRGDSKSSLNERHLINIFASIDSNNIEEFKDFLQKAPKNILLCHLDGQLIIHRIVQLNRVELLRFILDENKTNFSDLKCKIGGDTLWHLAAKSNNTEIIKILCQKCRPTTEINKQKESVLDIVIKYNDIKLVKQFLHHGFRKVNLFEATGDTVIFAELISKIKNLNIYNMNDQGQTLLHAACRKGNISLTRSLIADGFDINHIDNEGRTALHMAIKARDLDLVIFLFTNKALLKPARRLWPSKTKFIPVIHEAIDYEDPVILNFLIKNGADVNARDPAGFNAIALAVKRKLADQILIDLLEAGSDPTIPDKTGRTAVQALKDNKNMISFIFKIVSPKELCFVLPRLSNQHPESNCPICKEPILESEPMYLLNCKHHYHNDCLDYWFESSSNCPQCNETILKII